MVNIYRDAKRRGIYPPLFSDLRGIVVLVFTVPNQMDKKTLLQFLLLKFSQMTQHFSLLSQNSEYPRIFRVTGANQNARKLLSTDLVNTNNNYYY